MDGCPCHVGRADLTPLRVPPASLKRGFDHCCPSPTPREPSPADPAADLAALKECIFDRRDVAVVILNHLHRRARTAVIRCRTFSEPGPTRLSTYRLHASSAALRS